MENSHESCKADKLHVMIFQTLDVLLFSLRLKFCAVLPRIEVECFDSMFFGPFQCVRIFHVTQDDSDLRVQFTSLYRVYYGLKIGASP